VAQAVQLVEPTTLNVPAEHVMLEVALGQKEPAAHTMQLEAPVLG